MTQPATITDLRRAGAVCHEAGDVAFEVSMSGTRWMIQATEFTAGWPRGAAPGGFVLVILGDGAYAGRAHPLAWGDGRDPLASDYVGEKFGIKQARDRCDLTRILSEFLTRPPLYGDDEVAAFTLRADMRVGPLVVPARPRREAKAMKIYRGARTPQNPRCVEVVEEDAAVRPLHHIPFHSSIGMEWGYAGSGPADLALAILADHFEEHPTPSDVSRGFQTQRCPCVPTGRTGQAKDDCPQCDGSGQREVALRCLALHQDFKLDVIARLPRAGPWQLTSDQVSMWVQKHVTGGA